MTWDPTKMTYGEMDRAREAADLCRACRHREVCPVPADLSRREGWHLAVATCAHHEPETFAGDEDCDLCGEPPEEHDCRSAEDVGAVVEPPLALRWRMLWAEVMAAHARDCLSRAERNKDDPAVRGHALGSYYVAVQQAERLLAEARREWSSEVEG